MKHFCRRDGVMMLRVGLGDLRNLNNFGSGHSPDWFQSLERLWLH